MKQKIFIKTFGCQMNEYDSDRIYDSVKKIGFQKTDNYEDADCYLLNTCHIRDKAKEKVYHEIGRVKKFFKVLPLIKASGAISISPISIILCIFSKSNKSYKESYNGLK